MITEVKAETAADAVAPISAAQEGEVKPGTSPSPAPHDVGSSLKVDDSGKAPSPGVASPSAEAPVANDTAHKKESLEDAALTSQVAMQMPSSSPPSTMRPEEKQAGVKTTINSKFRASPILKNPKDETAAPADKIDGGGQPAPPAPQAKPQEPIHRPEPKRAKDRDRDAYYADPNPWAKDGEAEDGPNVISPNRPMMSYRHGAPYPHTRPPYYAPYSYGYPHSPSRPLPGPNPMYQYSPVRTKSPEWGSRRPEYPSPSRTAPKEPLTPRGDAGLSHPAHHPFSPQYLSSPFAGWHSPYPRHGWESPEGKAPMFRDKLDDDKRPSPYARPPPSWGNFSEPFGPSFDEAEPPSSASKPPFARTPPRGGSKPPPLPPPMPEEHYWGEYGHPPPPYDPYHMYSPPGPPPPSWSMSPGRMPPPPPTSTPGKKSSRGSKASGAPSSRGPPSSSSAPGAAAVTPTSSQQSALQQYGAAVDYCKNRLQELLQLSSPAKSGSLNDIPPMVVLEPAPGKLFGEITNHDVLLGRGGGTNTQAGNKRFRTIVNAHQPMYLDAKRKEKPLIARCIVEWIRQKGGRFLTKEESSGKWYEVGDLRAEAKTSQALREGLEVRATKNSATSCGGSVGSNGGSRKRSKKAKTETALPIESTSSYEQDPWEGPPGGYMPPGPHPPHFYGRPPNFYEHSRRIRGRQPEDPYGSMPPYPHYGPPPPYHPADYGSPAKRPRWTPHQHRDSAGSYPSVPNALSEEDRQYYKDFSPPASKSCKVPVVAPSYDAGDPAETQ